MSRPCNQLSKINDRSDKLSAKDGGIRFPRPFTELLGLKDKKYHSQDPIRVESLVLLQDLFFKINNCSNKEIDRKMMKKGISLIYASLYKISFSNFPEIVTIPSSRNCLSIQSFQSISSISNCFRNPNWIFPIGCQGSLGFNRSSHCKFSANQISSKEGSWLYSLVVTTLGPLLICSDLPLDYISCFSNCIKSSSQTDLID